MKVQLSGFQMQKKNRTIGQKFRKRWSFQKNQYILQNLIWRKRAKAVIMNMNMN